MPLELVRIRDWDYDGVNEMVLADIKMRPEPFSAGFELHSDRRFDRRPRAIGECRGRRD
jgi:hypothetical protein